MIYDYVVIINARNEELLLPICLEGIMNQIISPQIILVVNDGSIDRTSDVCKAYDVEELYLDTRRIDRRGINQSYAFNKGIEYINDLGIKYDTILKVDADVAISKKYSFDLITKLYIYKKLGICGGRPTNKRIRYDRVTDGARVIRKDCWVDINGYDLCTGFDSLALWKAVNKGWLVRTFNNFYYDELRDSDKHSLRRWFYAGQLRKQSNFPFYYTFLGALKNIRTGKPPIIGAITMMLSHLLTRDKYKFDDLDPDIIREYCIKEIKHLLVDSKWHQ